MSTTVIFQISLDWHTIVMNTCIFDSFGRDVCVCVFMSRKLLQMCECSSWIKWLKCAVMSVLLTVLGWRDQCQLLYHKWWCVSSSWWNSESLAASCGSTDAWLDSVNIYFLSCIYCTMDILHYVGFCLEQFLCPSGSASRQASWRTETICWWS